MKNVLGIWRESRLRLFLPAASFLVLLLITNFPMFDAAAASPQDNNQTKASQSEQTAEDGSAALTIYNQNFFVARELVPLDLHEGVNEAHYTGVAAHLEPDSVILRDPRGRALQILEQNYRTIPFHRSCCFLSMKARRLTFQ